MACQHIYMMFSGKNSKNLLGGQNVTTLILAILGTILGILAFNLICYFVGNIVVNNAHYIFENPAKSCSFAGCSVVGFIWIFCLTITMVLCYGCFTCLRTISEEIKVAHLESIKIITEEQQSVTEKRI